MKWLVRRDRVRAGFICGGAMALVAACAVMETPPGGPEDTSPPRIVETVPRPDSSKVGRDVRPAITFSEKIDPQSVKNRIFLFPPLEFASIDVSGKRLDIDFTELLPETTFCLLIGAGIRDYHRVENKQNYFLFFSTSDSIARGELSGVISFKSTPDSMGVAELFPVRADTVTDFRSSRRARIAFAGKDGRFTLKALPTDGSRFLLRAFIDRDADGRYSAGKEFAAVLPDTVVLTPSSERVEEIRINVIDPNEPGSVEGLVVNETEFTLAPTVRLSPVKSGEPSHAARADSTGSFILRGVPPGAYLLSAFVDLRADTLCGTYVDPADSTRTLAEPCVALPDTLRVQPGELLKLEPITVR